VPIAGGKRGAWGEGKDPLKPGAANVVLSSVRAVLAELAKRSLIPMKKADVHEHLCNYRVDPREVRVLKPGEIKKLLNAALKDNDPDVPQLVAALLLSGCRIGEALQLRATDVNHETGVIRIAGTATKTRMPRTIDLARTPVLAALLKRRGTGPLFTITRDRAKSIQSRLIRRAQLGFKWSWHTLRKTCGAYLACGPWGAYAAAATLGHGVQVSERHYLRAVRVPQDATTIEQAMGCEDLFERIAEGKAAPVRQITDAAG